MLGQVLRGNNYERADVLFWHVLRRAHYVVDSGVQFVVRNVVRRGVRLVRLLGRRKLQQPAPYLLREQQYYDYDYENDWIRQQRTDYGKPDDVGRKHDADDRKRQKVQHESFRVVLLQKHDSGINEQRREYDIEHARPRLIYHFIVNVFQKPHIFAPTNLVYIIIKLFSIVFKAFFEKTKNFLPLSPPHKRRRAPEIDAYAYRAAHDLVIIC